ncbi:hypothetical protein BB560_003895 [Smittium megazygosporum]|uniref:Uncharacterized protein n=1 Tax=Smittium megazygosporum TaxID=133381 RepID=A0A2T9ZAV9_9FUNG|nr:hypothetical protein BB560_003895 [Smittium megazygosporum]
MVSEAKNRIIELREVRKGPEDSLAKSTRQYKAYSDKKGIKGQNFLVKFKYIFPYFSRTLTLDTLTQYSNLEFLSMSWFLTLNSELSEEFNTSLLETSLSSSGTLNVTFNSSGLFRKSRQGKPIRKALVRSYMESAELPLLENVRKMHSACKSRPGISSSVLALVSQVYTIEQLKDFGFEFSSNQYSLSRKKASEENFTLVEYERHSPTSKTKVSDETKAKVSDILHEFSNSSSSTISLGTAGNGYQEIRYLTKPKRDIYYVLKEKNPGIQFSPKKIKKNYDTAKANENASLEQIMRLRVATEEFEVHKRLALEQRKNFKNQISGLSADYKENFKIGGGPIETTRYFYQKSQISELCTCVVSKSGDQIQRRYYNYLSENLSHDSLYAINCLKKLLYRLEFQEFEEVNLWSDSGPHFKNADYLYSVCLELPQIFPSKKFKLNYFMENHRKSDVDGHFGDLSQGDDGLMACRFSLPGPSKYFNIDFRIKVKRDIRTNKYAADGSNPLGSDTDIMGSTSRNTQRIRVEILRGIGVSLSI